VAVTEQGGDAAHVQGALVTSDLFSLLRVNPILGRYFNADDDKPGTRVVIIGHDLWQRRFGGDRRIIERSITLDGVGYQVIGVMPAGFQFPIQNRPRNSGPRPRRNSKSQPAHKPKTPPQRNAACIIYEPSRA
jgi:hypothetical protein